MKIVVEGIPPWDGDYEFDGLNFTNREFFRIKEISGIRASELIEALEAGDTGAYVAVAAVVMLRQGKFKEGDIDDLWAGPVGSVTLDVSGDADPPTTTGDGNEPTETPASSGEDSGATGD